MVLSFSKTSILLLLLFATLLAPLPSSAELIDRVIAVVNNEVITSTELKSSWEPIRQRIREKTPSEKLEATLAEEQSKVLANMIDELLINQEANTMKIRVSEAEVDEGVGRIAENNNVSVEELKKEIERTGIGMKNFRKNIFSNIQRSKLVSRKINSSIVISDEKAKEYYEKTFTGKNSPEGYHLLQIGFTWGTKDSSASTPDEAEQRANKIRKLVAEGQDFKELARSFSELPSAEDGGDLGFLSEDDMSENMREILVGLEPGKASEVIMLSGSYQFFMILSVNTYGTTRYAPFDVFKNMIVHLLYNKEQKKRYSKWMKDIRERSYIKTLL